MVIQNTLYLFLSLDIAFIILVMFTKHFGLRFAYDFPKILNDLSDDVHSAIPLHSSSKKLKTYLFA